MPQLRSFAEMAVSRNSRRFEWFCLEEYAPITRFICRDWAAMLEYRLRSREEYVDRSSTLDDQSIWRQKKHEFWSAYWNRVSPKLYFDRKRTNDEQNIPGREAPVREVTQDLLLGSDAEMLSLITWQVVFPGMRVLLINPWAGDSALQTNFKLWLEQMRKHHTTPIKRRGRKGANIELTEQHFDSWANYNILAVFDIDFWCEVFEEKRASAEELHALINPEHRDYKDWSKKARAKVKDAIAMREYLLTQAQRSAR
jgi:Family of unknown function (DUF6387)